LGFCNDYVKRHPATRRLGVGPTRFKENGHDVKRSKGCR
jgi:hypothetical protein